LPLRAIKRRETEAEKGQGVETETRNGDVMRGREGVFEVKKTDSQRIRRKRRSRNFEPKGGTLRPTNKRTAREEKTDKGRKAIQRGNRVGKGARGKV